MDAGQGYRLLKRGEVKEAGDQWKYRNEEDWKPVILVGEVFQDLDPGYRFVRRKIDPCIF